MSAMVKVEIGMRVITRDGTGTVTGLSEKGASVELDPIEEFYSWNEMTVLYPAYAEKE